MAVIELSTLCCRVAKYTSAMGKLEVMLKGKAHVEQDESENTIIFVNQILELNEMYFFAIVSKRDSIKHYQ